MLLVIRTGLVKTMSLKSSIFMVYISLPVFYVKFQVLSAKNNVAAFLFSFYIFMPLVNLWFIHLKDKNLPWTVTAHPPSKNTAATAWIPIINENQPIWILNIKNPLFQIIPARYALSTTDGTSAHPEVRRWSKRKHFYLVQRFLWVAELVEYQLVELETWVRILVLARIFT